MQTRSLSLIRDNKSAAAHAETHTTFLNCTNLTLQPLLGTGRRTRKENEKKGRAEKRTMVEKQLKERQYRASCHLPGAAKWVLLFAVLMPERGVQVQGQTCADAADPSATWVSCDDKGLTAVPAFGNPDAIAV